MRTALLKASRQKGGRKLGEEQKCSWESGAQLCRATWAGRSVHWILKALQSQRLSFIHQPLLSVCCVPGMASGARMPRCTGQRRSLHGTWGINKGQVKGRCWAVSEHQVWLGASVVGLSGRPLLIPDRMDPVRRRTGLGARWGNHGARVGSLVRCGDLRHGGGVCGGSG